MPSTRIKKAPIQHYEAFRTCNFCGLETPRTLTRVLRIRREDGKPGLVCKVQCAACEFGIGRKK